MTKPFTFRGILTMMLLAAGLQTVLAQAFWTETFSDQTTALANWIHSGTNGGTKTWDWTNMPDAGSYSPGIFAAPTAATGYMWFDSDGNGDFARATGLDADYSGGGMGVRSKRYSMVVEDGVVKTLNVEESPANHDASSATAMCSL